MQSSRPDVWKVDSLTTFSILIMSPLDGVGTFSARGVPAGQENKVIEVGAGQAKRTALSSQKDPGVAPERLTTVAAFRFATGDEYFQILDDGHGCTRMVRS